MRLGPVTSGAFAIDCFTEGARWRGLFASLAEIPFFDVPFAKVPFFEVSFLEAPSPEATDFSRF